MSIRNKKKNQQERRTPESPDGPADLRIKPVIDMIATSPHHKNKSDAELNRRAHLIIAVVDMFKVEGKAVNAAKVVDLWQSHFRRKSMLKKEVKVAKRKSVLFKERLKETGAADERGRDWIKEIERVCPKRSREHDESESGDTELTEDSESEKEDGGTGHAPSTKPEEQLVASTGEQTAVPGGPPVSFSPPFLQ